MQPQLYLMYLRKSRADAEAEARGEGETLARHERLLMALAKQKNLAIGDTYREIESGDSIAARPMMQQLLSEVEQGMWAGVLVMEVERLARGDTIDQGLVAQAFRFSDTKIVTPIKVYDPSNEFDEEYFEFGLFMARREYKTIRRRMERGRLAAAMEGKYVGNKPPYGYERKRLEHTSGWTLEPIPEEADVVRMVYDLYINGDLQPDGTYMRIGLNRIAKKLNSMDIPTRKGGPWTLATLRDMVINPVYAGKIRWKWRPQTKKVVDGAVTISRPINIPEDCVVAQGLHKPIISAETFNAAQDVISVNLPRPIKSLSVIKNPLAGIIVCGKCGRRLVRKTYAEERNIADGLACPLSGCQTASAPLALVERSLLDSLAEWADGHILEWQQQKAKLNATSDVQKKAAEKLRQEVADLGKQQGQLHDLLEQGVYTVDVFLERSTILAQRLADAKERLAENNAETEKALVLESQKNNIVPKIQHLLGVYDTLESPQAKNDLLREVVDKALYFKPRDRTRRVPDGFRLVLYPRVPHDIHHL